MKTNNEGFLGNRSNCKKKMTHKGTICKAWFMALSAVTTTMMFRGQMPLQTYRSTISRGHLDKNEIGFAWPVKTGIRGIFQTFFYEFKCPYSDSEIY